MKFVNRKKELEFFEEYYRLSKEKLFPIVLYGQRRIGKTQLVKEFIKDKKYMYFFVDNAKNSNLLLNEFLEYLKDEGLISKFEKIISWKEFFEIIFNRLNDYIIIFDEFQNFSSIDKSIFSIIQYFIDENENNKGMFIFLGSIIGLMKEIFENQREPLFGRIKFFYNLKELSFKHSIKLMNQLGIVDFKSQIEFYSIFGGYPRYYVLLEDLKLKGNIFNIIEKVVINENSILKNEVINTLRLNFGNGKQSYYSILEAIGSGNTKISEIANYINLPVTSTSFFINDLIENYGFIKRIIPITEIHKKNNKQGIYKIENNYFNFYFRFIFKNKSLLEFNLNNNLLNKIKNNLVYLISFKFEDICKDFLSEINSNYIYGTWWNRQGIEIDICGINDEKNKILFGECKWQDNIDASKILRELKEKSQYVKWSRDVKKESGDLGEGIGDDRIEEFVIFAKSFKEFRYKRVENGDIRNVSKEIWENENNCKLYDLKDLERIFMK